MTEAYVNVTADCEGTVTVGIGQAGLPAAQVKPGDVLEIWGDLHAGGPGDTSILGHFEGAPGLQFVFHNVPAGEHTIGVNVRFPNLTTSPRASFTVPEACTTTTVATDPSSSTTEATPATTTPVVIITEDSVPQVVFHDPFPSTTVEITTQVGIAPPVELPRTGASATLFVPAGVGLLVMGALFMRVAKWKLGKS